MKGLNTQRDTILGTSPVKQASLQMVLKLCRIMCVRVLKNPYVLPELSNQALYVLLKPYKFLEVKSETMSGNSVKCNIQMPS